MHGDDARTRREAADQYDDVVVDGLGQKSILGRAITFQRRAYQGTFEGSARSGKGGDGIVEGGRLCIDSVDGRLNFLHGAFHGERERNRNERKREGNI